MYEALKDDSWLKGEFITTVQQRGAAVIKARKLSSAMSAAKAIADHIRDIWFGTPEVRVLICTGLSFWIEKNAIKPVGFIS